MLSLLAVLIYGTALVAAAASDLVRYEIPNRLSLALAGSFAVAAPATLDLGTLGWHLVAGATVFVATALLFARGVMGGGDVKLMSTAALWIGWSALPGFLLLIALIGAAIAAMLIALRRFAPAPALPVPGHWYSRLLIKEQGVPYGIAISGAGLIFVPQLFAWDAAHQTLMRAFGG